MKTIMTGRQLILMLDVFDFMINCMSDLVKSGPSVVDHLSLSQNPRGFTRNTLKVLDSRVPLPCVLGFYNCLRVGSSLLRYFRENRENLIDDDDRMWNVSALSYELWDTLSLDARADQGQFVQLFGLFATDELTEESLKG